MIPHALSLSLSRLWRICYTPVQLLRWTCCSVYIKYLYPTRFLAGDQAVQSLTLIRITLVTIYGTLSVTLATSATRLQDREAEDGQTQDYETVVTICTGSGRMQRLFFSHSLHDTFSPVCAINRLIDGMRALRSVCLCEAIHRLPLQEQRTESKIESGTTERALGLSLILSTMCEYYSAGNRDLSSCGVAVPIEQRQFQKLQTIGTSPDSCSYYYSLPRPSSVHLASRTPSVPSSKMAGESPMAATDGTLSRSLVPRPPVLGGMSAHTARSGHSFFDEN